jgi:hypothetical protein
MTRPRAGSTSLKAADGHAHRIVEKVPVLTDEEITAATTFPLELWIRGAGSPLDQNAAKATLADGITTTDGLNSLTLLEKNVVRL